MPFSCENCQNRKTCVSLCQKAEKYVNQDYTYQRELPIKEVIFIKRCRFPPGYFSEYQVNFKFLTPLQNKILHLFYFEGLSYAKIAYRLSNQYKQYTTIGIKKRNYRTRIKIRNFFHISEGGNKNDL